MAVQWCKQIASREAGDDDKFVVTAQRVYLVKCSDKDIDGPEVAIAATPPVYSYYVGTFPYLIAAPGLVCVKRDCREREVTADGGSLYEVTLDYKTLTPDPKQQDPNPLNRAAIITLGFDAYEETRYQAPDLPDAVDASGAAVALGPQPGRGVVIVQGGFKWGKAICNSAGDPFDPSIVDTYYDPVLTVRKNLPALPWTLVQQYCNAVNSDSFRINYRGQVYAVANGTAWMSQMTSTSEYENGVEYEAVTAIIKIRKDGWRRMVLDQGFQQLNNGDLPARPIRDANGDPVVRPALLDGNGQALKPGKLPVFLRWFFKGWEAFGNLPFWNG